MEKKKSIRFYLVVAVAVLCLIGIFFYRKAMTVESIILIGGVTAGVLAIVIAVLGFMKIQAEAVNLIATICAVILGWTLIRSVNAQLDSLGFWISGLYSFDQVKGFLFFAGCVLVAIILNLIASFMDVQN